MSPWSSQKNQPSSLAITHYMEHCTTTLASELLATTENPKSFNTENLPPVQQIKMMRRSKLATIKKDQLSSDCAIFLLILMVAFMMIVNIACDPGSSVLDSSGISKQMRQLRPFLTLATLDDLNNQQQIRSAEQQQQLAEWRLNNGVNGQEETASVYIDISKVRPTAPIKGNSSKRSIQGNQKNGKIGLDASHLLREIYLDADSTVLLLPANDDKDSSSVQKFHPNGRYGRRSSNDFAEPFHEEALKMSKIPINGLVHVNRQFRGLGEPIHLLDTTTSNGLLDLERLENLYKTMRQQIVASNKRAIGAAGLFSTTGQQQQLDYTNHLDDTGDIELTRDATSNNCSYSGFAGLILCH